jgi:MFS family permease
MLFTKNIFFCYLSIFVFTLGEILNTLASSPFLTRRIPASHRGRIMSVMGVSVSMGGALLRNLVGSVYDQSGSRIAWALVLALGLGEILMIFIMRKYDRKEYKELYSEVTKETDL